MSKFIFVTGGVVSSLGKGIVAASIGNILQNEGFSIKIKKLDPYLNIDPGTMNPIEHGEVFITGDGGETDLDLGHYERFTNIQASKNDNITSGKIYQNLIQKERKGDYIGKTVQVVPHVTDLIKEFILYDSEKYDFVICEIGGTVGDIEGQPFLEAIRQLRYELKNDTLSVHLTLLPYISASDEIKTKPTQHSIKELMSYGINADILICRTSVPLDYANKKKLSAFCNILPDNLIEAPDVKNIYSLPIVYAENGLDKAILKHFNLDQNKELYNKNIQIWKDFIYKMDNLQDVVKIAIVGKYTVSKDSYKSLIEALQHACIQNNLKADIQLIDSNKINNQKTAKELLNNFQCIVIPGGFGSTGIDGKIEAIRYSRENDIPFLGICFGMQLSIIEFCRNVCNMKNATSRELINQNEKQEDYECVVDIMNQWIKDDAFENRTNEANLGGTMRLGNYRAKIKNPSLAYKIYQSENIIERHRHRYEVNIKYRSIIEQNNGLFSGLSQDEQLPEIFEIKDHKFFIAVQFHPEFLSKPLKPHPIFTNLIKSTIEND